MLPTICGVHVLVLALGCSGSSDTASAVNAGAVPTISSSPANVSVKSGASASFSVAASGNPAPTFAWERSNDKGSTWTPVNGVTAATYAFTAAIADDGAQFRAKAANTQGSTTSAIATLAVDYTNMLMVGGIYQPIAGTTVLTLGYWKNGTWTALPVLEAEQNNLPQTLRVFGTDVYVTGWNRVTMPGDSPHYGSWRSGYWKNDVWVALPALDPAKSAVVSDVLVAGTDLYATGYCKDSADNPQPTYWKNGVRTALSKEAASAGRMAMMGSDLYIMGGTGYWKNGTWVGFPTGTRCNDVLVSGNDLYFAGYNAPSAGTVNPGYWKNGTWTGLTPPSGVAAATAVRIVLSGSDVYVLGLCSGLPGYWKNGSWVALPVLDPTKSQSVSQLLVYRGDVYVSGICSDTANNSVGGYWKNGVWTASKVPSGVSSALVYGISLQ